MRFGEVVRAHRAAKGLTLRALGERVGDSYACISKVESHKIDFGEYPSADLIRRLASVLGGNEEAWLLLAEKIPETIRRRLFERPDGFRRIARLDDEALDRLLTLIVEDGTPEAASELRNGGRGKSIPPDAGRSEVQTWPDSHT